MKTLEKEFLLRKERGEKIFVPYIMAGDGGLVQLKNQIHYLQKSGATAIEIGIPFSDPVADGEVIQRAGMRALDAGVTLQTVFQTLTNLKQAKEQEQPIPLIMMTYLNPILAYGVDSFIASCEKSGVSGLIVPDVPFEESEFLRTALAATDIALIQLVTLTSSVERVRKIIDASEGFVYAVTVKGITGMRDELDENLRTYLQTLSSKSRLPVLAGFGISTIEQIQELCECSDGVIVGSAIVEAFYQQDERKIQQLVQAVQTL